MPSYYKVALPSVSILNKPYEFSDDCERLKELQLELIKILKRLNEENKFLANLRKVILKVLFEVLLKILRVYNLKN
jgi:hypothetical protein